jgi:cytochrome b involved in lipid metabolism
MAPADKGDLKSYSFDDLKAHTTYDSCWLLLEGKVYDVTKFLDEHPGGMF